MACVSVLLVTRLGILSSPKRLQTEVCVRSYVNLCYRILLQNNIVFELIICAVRERYFFQHKINGTRKRLKRRYLSVNDMNHPHIKQTFSCRCKCVPFTVWGGMVIPSSLCHYSRSRFTCFCAVCWQHRTVCTVRPRTLTLVCFCALSLVFVYGQHFDGLRAGIQSVRRLSVMTT